MLSICILIFVVLETANVVILYFKTDSRIGNGVAVFDDWELSKKDENMHLFIKYLVYWVAGTKLIFICLLLVIAMYGDDLVQKFGVGAMVLSISSYYWKLAPIMKQLDLNQKITPQGYSKYLNMMIAGFLLMFGGALVYSIVK